MANFSASSRAVEMLGRQQIANLPTAISELFKNGYDAYALRAEAEFFRSEQLLVIHDDGLGMDSEEFRDRWLTLATDSKSRPRRAKPPRGRPKRHPLGEKGIGRLAVGALGDQALIVSQRRDRAQITVLVNWDLFTLPGLTLDEIPVPLIEHDGESVVDVTRQLVGEVLEFLTKESERGRLDSSESQIAKIIRDLEGLDRDVYALTGLRRLSRRRTGTHFFVTPVAEALWLDAAAQGKGASYLQQTLHGFSCDWLGTARSADPFSVAFRDHDAGGRVSDILDPLDFFVEDDFGDVDHLIDGEFDQEGIFHGRVRIFDADSHDYVLHPPAGRAPRCGPFGVKFGVLQGEQSKSRLDPEAWNNLRRRLDALGGLYVYKDGIRVQPYGRPDVDYLEVEERRSRGAGYYFFSYRRMFGGVTLTSQRNGRLVEKAGREGFTQGAAYRDFRDLLINLLEQLAATFFRSDGAVADDYLEGQARNQATKQAAAERQQRTRAGRRRVGRELSAAFKALERTDFDDLVATIVKNASEAASAADRLEPASRALSAARSALGSVLDPLYIAEPEDFALTAEMEVELRQVEQRRGELTKRLIDPAFLALDALSESTAERLRGVEANLAQRKAFVDEQLSQSRQAVAEQKADTDAELQVIIDAVREAIHGATKAFEQIIPKIVPDVKKEDWLDSQATFEVALRDATSTAVGALRTTERDLSIASLFLDDTSVGPAAMAAAADSEILDLKAQADAQLELVLLGQAISVVDHEFAYWIENIRRDVRRFGQWAKKNPKLVGLYNDLRRDFDHLDGYLSLLTPLQRRIRRSPVTIRGSDLAHFLETLFEPRLASTGCELSATRDFTRFRVEGYTSTFYPVFVNLIDNSIHWLSTHDGPRTIELDAEGDKLIVRDSGPGVDRTFADRIFDFGFSTRPGGSGLGLTIAQRVLERAGWSLSYQGADSVTEFVIERAEVEAL